MNKDKTEKHTHLTGMYVYCSICGINLYEAKLRKEKIDYFSPEEAKKQEAIYAKEH